MKIFETKTIGYWNFIKIFGFEFRILKIKKLAGDLDTLHREVDTLRNDLTAAKESLNYFFDITKIPTARGKIRQVQLLNNFLLKELKAICDNINIKFWLAGGTLLGARRHGGFIPWDDDLDVNILREDFNKLIEYVNNNSEEYIIKYFYHHGCKVAKFTFKNLSSPVFVDIFPFDYCNFSQEIIKQWKDDKTELMQKMKELTFEEGYENTLSEKEIKAIENLNDSYKVKYYNTTPDTGICMGIEQVDTQNYKHCYKTDIIFPLSEIIFEGHKYYAPSNIEKYLELNYCDYMKLPESINPNLHSFMFSKEDYDAVEEMYAKYVK